MAHVRALFRVLHVTHDHSGLQIVKMAPTYGTRDGQPAEVNKAFWEATPSGDGEIKLARSVTDDVRELFAAGGYVHLDLIDDEPEIIGQAAAAIRTDWQLDHVELRPDSFRVRLSVVAGPWEPSGRQNGRNGALIGGGYDGGYVEMTINNLAVLPFFEMTPRKGGTKRRIVIDFSPA